MTLDANDPRLTAYALGELAGRERSELEAELGESPEGQRALAEIRTTAALLAGALAAGPAAALDEPRRAAIVAAVGELSHDNVADAREVLRPMLRRPNQGRRQGGRRHWHWAAAAAVPLVAAVWLAFTPAVREAARRPVVALAEQKEPSNATPMVRGHVVRAAGPAEPTTGAPSRTAPVVHGAGGSVLPKSTTEPTGAPVGGGQTATIPALPGAVTHSASSAREHGYTIAKPLYETPGARAALIAKPGLTPSDSQLEEIDRPAARPLPLGVKAETWSTDDSYAGERLHERSAEQEVIRYAPQQSVSTPPASGGMGGGMGSLGRPADAHYWAWHDRREGESTRFRYYREPDGNTEAYDAPVENPFRRVAQEPLSTFSIDVDTASYANVRRFLNQGALPPPAAVRIEELLNYFRYDYSPPKEGEPFAAHTAVVACPWAPANRLVRVAIKGREIENRLRPASNLVFLLDVSGSMQDANKLPLVKEGLRLMVEKLGENDRVAIVVYAGSSGLVLDSTTGDQRQKILSAIDGLQAGGSTNGASGIELAYDTAIAHLVPSGTNRVILATDGDFNVGVTDRRQLVQMIERKAKSGVYLSVLGFGMGNLKDATLEQLADKGNGNYAYIDTPAEARKVLAEQLSGTLVTIAKDVKVQTEFNPAKVQAYRLIGYENRVLAKEDFNDDRKDAGEIGAGHTVTALYEVVPAGSEVATPQPGVDPLEFQPGPPVEAPKVAATEKATKSNDLLMVKLRYKEPGGETSKLLKFPVADGQGQISAAGDDFEFAAAVAALGMLLRNSPHRGTATYGTVLELAQSGIGTDPEGYRREFVELVRKAERIAPR